MYPIALDLKKIPILLVGTGEMLARRLRQLKEGGATQINVIEGIVPEAEIHKATLVMATGLSRKESEAIAKAARAAGKLVNIEDVNDLCDFYFTANVRRGDLVIAVSTSGASPTLARKIRDWIGIKFGEEWTGRVEEIASLRKQWKNEGKPLQEVLSASEDHISKRQWLG